MTDTPGEIVERLKLANRPGASRKLLARKAAENTVAVEPEGNALEDVFPMSGAQAASNAVPLGKAATANGGHTGHAPALPSAWSDEDETAFLAMSARRKAAGYRRRGRDVSNQLLRCGAINPNPGTVSATLVGLLAGGSMSRSALLDAMAQSTFPHPKAKPHDRNWCQGYVAGALRDGYLAIASVPSTESTAAESTARVQ